MGLLDRLRSWLGIGTDTQETNEADEDDGNESSEPTGLDPDNVTEVRTEGDDDAAEKLRELSQGEQETDEES